MQEMRLELTRDCSHTDLNRARLPIPPFLRDNKSYITLIDQNCQDFLN